MSFSWKLCTITTIAVISVRKKSYVDIKLTSNVVCVISRRPTLRGLYLVRQTEIMPDLQPKNSKRQSEPATQHVTYSYRNIETPTVIETFHQLQKLSLKYNKQTNSFYAPYSRPTQVRWHQFNQNTHHSLSPLSSPLTYPRI